MLLLHMHRAGLKPLLAFPRDVGHDIAALELVEAAVDDGILVKIDLLAVGGLDEAVALPGEEPRQPPLISRCTQMEAA